MGIRCFSSLLGTALFLSHTSISIAAVNPATVVSECAQGTNCVAQVANYHSDLVSSGATTAEIDQALSDLVYMLLRESGRCGAAIDSNASTAAVNSRNKNLCERSLSDGIVAAAGAVSTNAQKDEYMILANQILNDNGTPWVLDLPNTLKASDN